jgi:hypothetical protein
MIPQRLFQILKFAESNESSHFPLTNVFNEGWMLRLILDAVQTFSINSELRFLAGSRWYSEALLDSCFQPATKSDPLGEGHAHADAVIGHFDFREETRTGLRLRSCSRQFVVVEAKMFSNLSQGTKNAPTYDQAARNVACMATTIAHSNLRVNDLESVGFFVIAPRLDERHNRNTNLESRVRFDSIRSAVCQRIADYETGNRPETVALRKWEHEYFHPLIDRLCAESRLNVLCWDETLEAIAKVEPSYGVDLKQFYERCLSMSTFEFRTCKEKKTMADVGPAS